MKKIIAFIILVILIILIITCSYNYYKNKNNNKSRVNKLKSDLDTSEILDSKSNRDDDVIEIEEKDASDQKKDEKKKKSDNKKNSDSKKDSKKSDSNNKSSDAEDDLDNSSVTNEEETHLDVPDTASDDDSGFIKLDYYTIDTVNSTIKVGKTTKIIVNYYPENASVKDTTFVSETKRICKVSSLGKITGLRKGTCSIVVRVKDQSSKSLLLTVK